MWAAAHVLVNASNGDTRSTASAKHCAILAAERGLPGSPPRGRRDVVSPTRTLSSSSLGRMNRVPEADIDPSRVSVHEYNWGDSRIALP